MYAIIETGGKQIKVAVGETIYVEKLAVATTETVTFDKVLLIADQKVTVGNPYVTGANVTGTVEKHGKGKKIHIYKYTAKSGSSHRRQGHRQPYTKVLIEAINA